MSKAAGPLPSSRAKSRDPEVTLKLSRRIPRLTLGMTKLSLRSTVFALDPIERFLPRLEGAFELASFYCFQDFAKSWTRFHSQRDQIVPRNQRWRNDRLVRELFLFALEKFIIVEHGMTARAIDPMQFQFLFESGTRHEPLQFGHTHPRHVFENHVLTNHLHGGVDFSARKTQALHDLFGHFRAEAIVFVETDAIVRIYRCRPRFGDIVQNDAENERHGNVFRQKLQH